MYKAMKKVRRQRTVFKNKYAPLGVKVEEIKVERAY